MTSFVTALALSGSPAVLAACMPMCLHGMPAEAVGHQSGVSPDIAVQAASRPANVASGHEHHHEAAAVYQPAASVDGEAPSPRSSNARLSADCDQCCSMGQVAFAAGPGVERIDPHAFGAAPVAARVASFLVTASPLGVPSPSPPVPPPAPARASLVLRV